MTGQVKVTGKPVYQEATPLPQQVEVVNSPRGAMLDALLINDLFLLIGYLAVRWFFG